MPFGAPPPFCWECLKRQREKRRAAERAKAREEAKKRLVKALRKLKERMRQANEDMARIKRTEQKFDDEVGPWDPQW